MLTLEHNKCLYKCINLFPITTLLPIESFTLVLYGTQPSHSLHDRGQGETSKGGTMPRYQPITIRGGGISQINKTKHHSRVTV